MNDGGTSSKVYRSFFLLSVAQTVSELSTDFIYFRLFKEIYLAMVGWACQMNELNTADP